MSGFARRTGSRTVFERALTVVLSIGLLLLGTGSPQFAVAQATAEARAALAAVMDFSRSLRDGLDRTRFDVEELSLELAFAEPEEIVTLVREQVAFEQYPGLLRGAEGTLVSGAGNALDQAVLLATLLGAAGFDVRIASGLLSEEQATELLRSMRPTASTRPAPSPASDAAAFGAALGVDEASLAQLNTELEAQHEALRSDATEAAGQLQARLAQAGLFGGGDVVADLVAEAQQYYWVEYGLGSDDWTPAHVLFDAGEQVEVEAEEYLVDEVPEELQHRFRFQVFIEQRLGEDLVVKPIMAAWERPAANLFGRGFDYLSLPDGFSKTEPGTELGEVLVATEFFTPVFSGGLADGAMMFDLEGNAVDPFAGSDQAAGVFKNIGSAFGRAAGALAGEEDPDTYVSLASQYFEYTLIAPGGTETVHRRVVFDRVADRASGSVALDPAISDADVAEALASSYSFMLNPGHYSADYITDRGLELTIAAGPILSEALDEGLDGGGMTVPLEYQDTSRGTDLLRLFGAFDDAPLSPDRISYRAEPSLVVIERAWQGERARVDVVANGRRVLARVEGALPQPDVAGAIEAGAWETRVESLPVASEATLRRDAYTLLEDAWRTGALAVISPEESAHAASLALPPASLAAIEEDLARGFAVVVPSGGAAEVEAVAWWRVDPATGETLGRTADGRGGVLTEYEQTLAVEKALMTGGLIIGAHTLVLGCLGKGSGLATACCLFEGVLINAGVIAIGAVLAGYFAVSAVVLFLLLDIGVGSALTVAGFMDALPSMCGGFAGSCRYTLAV